MGIIGESCQPGTASVMSDKTTYCGIICRLYPTTLGRYESLSRVAGLAVSSGTRRPGGTKRSLRFNVFWNCYRQTGSRPQSPREVFPCRQAAHRLRNGKVLSSKKTVTDIAGVADQYCEILTESPDDAWNRAFREKKGFSQKIRPGGVGNPCRGRIDRIPRQIGIAGCRIDLVLAQLFSGHRQWPSDGECPAYPTMTKLMELHALQVDQATRPFPATAGVAKRAIRLGAGNRPSVALSTAPLR